MNFKIIITIFSTFSFFKYSYSASKKHVVMIVADDLGWNDVSFHGSNQFLTPNIDTLAYSGVILHNYYVLPLCSPSRSALMTGIHPIHTGMHQGVIHNGQPFGLPLDLKILPEYLKEYGYTTRAVGKWHLGFHTKEYTPMYRGFDSHFGYWGSKEDYYTHKNELKFLHVYGEDFRRDMNTTWDYDGQYATDIFTQESVDIINSHNTSEPLFLYLAHLATHAGNSKHPLQAPSEIIEKFSYIEDKTRRIYAAMAWKLDELVGKVVQTLASKNMLNDTMIIFTTDNGGPTAGTEGNGASNWPLRGRKATLWEGGVRGVSFIWSADLPQSTRCNALMHIQDWLPTILAAIDENIANNATSLTGLDGNNMWPVLTGHQNMAYDELLIQRELSAGASALRKNEWKLITGLPKKSSNSKWIGPSGRDEYYTYNVTDLQNSSVALALSSQNFTIPPAEKIFEIRAEVTISCDYCNDNETDCTLCDVSKDEVCLFDLSKDPCEKNNLARTYPNITTNLLDIISKYVPVTPLNKPFDPRSNPTLWNMTWTNWMDYVDTKTKFNKDNNNDRQFHQVQKNKSPLLSKNLHRLATIFNF